MPETGPVPDAKTCWYCNADGKTTPIIWLWSPRIHGGLGGWVMFTEMYEGSLTISAHMPCEAKRRERDKL
jgi:hypothetical protein